jgi:hypothetical protein
MYIYIYIYMRFASPAKSCHLSLLWVSLVLRRVKIDSFCECSYVWWLRLFTCNLCLIDLIERARDTMLHGIWLWAPYLFFWSGCLHDAFLSQWRNCCSYAAIRVIVGLRWFIISGEWWNGWCLWPLYLCSRVIVITRPSQWNTANSRK